MDQETNLPQAVHDFMGYAAQSVRGFSPRQAVLYTGLQLEEMAEKLEAIAGGCVTMPEKARMLAVADQLNVLSLEFKQGKHMGDLMRANLADLLDADIDLAWVSLGAAYSTSTDPSAAFGEVARANLDKFPGGRALLDENGKVRKPDGWRPPDLSPFVFLDGSDD